MLVFVWPRRIVGSKSSRFDPWVADAHRPSRLQRARAKDVGYPSKPLVRRESAPVMGMPR
ncbi:hypothetical protein B1812_06955 [Methylocystis bryophila]|uniref:Uncharacterized protein n=1 Tax=Methylocystis bryophila TaxID=655015 RepID=A0A1W6MTD1_9HYPH|nr:hypothetical protein B1812_06955 [Methylocystis bryophila]